MIPPTDLFRRTAFGPVYEAAQLTAVDIGSRGGFDMELLPIAWAIGGIGFEPEPDAFAALQHLPATPWRSLRWLPAAIGPDTGKAMLHVPPDGNGASLLRHDPAIGDRFGLQHLTQNCRQIPVDTITLDDAAERWQWPAATYLKLDVEGAELAILETSPQAVSAAFAIKAEASFIANRIGQPLVTDLESFLRGRGFLLMDLVNTHRWRRRPVAPHPYSWAGTPPYSRGQLAQCDLIFLRDPAAIDMEDFDSALKAGLLAMTMGFFDHALDLFERPAVAGRLRLDWGIEPLPALSAASRIFGRHCAFAAIRRNLRDLIPLLRSLGAGIPG